MSIESMLTIVFRGLFVFRANQEQKLMEVGFLRDAKHFPRINTIKNGVLREVRDLRGRREVCDSTKPIWRIEVDKPLEGASIYTNGSVGFDRFDHPDERDFRWIINLEGNDFHNQDLTALLRTSQLMPIIHVPNGVFYTRMKSRRLERAQDDVAGGYKPFGFIAAASACDIRLTGKGAKLVVEKSGTEIMSLPAEPNTTYEIANLPPDIDPTLAPGDCPKESDFSLRHHGGSVEMHPPHDHFQHYYDLFTKPVQKFHFQAAAAPAPDPFLCGDIMLGTRSKPLGED